MIGGVLPHIPPRSIEHYTIPDLNLDDFPITRADCRRFNGDKFFINL